MEFNIESLELILPGIKELYEQKKTHHLVLKILKCLCERISDYKESQLQEASAYDAMLQAATLGITEYIDAMRKANPDLLWAIDKNKRGIFSHAILNRRKDVFRLINRVNGRKEIIKCRADAFGNNLLHLAAYLGPSSDLDRRSGAALQLQRELQWFKVIYSSFLIIYEIYHIIVEEGFKYWSCLCCNFVVFVCDKLQTNAIDTIPIACVDG